MTYIDASALAGPDGQVCQPRAWVSLSGTTLPCIAATVTRKSERKADTFTAELSIDETAEAGFGYAEWADFQPAEVGILMSLDGGATTSVITGMVDVPHIHWGECTVTLSGRDLSASLTEQRRSAQFKNQTSGEIVQQIAQAHGLSAAITAVGDFAGKIYKQDTVHLIQNLSDHEVLTRLAEREGFRWYVDGKTLYFEPRGTDTGLYRVLWVPPAMRRQPGSSQPGFATCLDLETHRNMTAARPHAMRARSWHHAEAKKFDGVADANGIGATVEVEHHHNGRNQAQVDKIAKSRLKDAIRHDCNVVVHAPLDLSVTPRQKMQLAGTGTIYDQLYDIDTVEMSISWDGGSEMTVTGKIAKAGRSGTDNTGATKNTAPIAPTPAAPAAGSETPVTTPQNSVGIGSA